MAAAVPRRVLHVDAQPDAVERLEHLRRAVADRLGEDDHGTLGELLAALFDDTVVELPGAGHLTPPR